MRSTRRGFSTKSTRPEMRTIVSVYDGVEYESESDPKLPGRLASVIGTVTGFAGIFQVRRSSF